MYARHQAALAELTQSVLMNADLPAFMGQALSLVAQTLAVAYSAIWELLPGRSALVLRAGVGWPAAALGRLSVELAATSSIGATLLGTTPAIVADWPSETRFHQPPHDHNAISSLSVVIKGPSGPIGSLGVDVTASRRFSDEEIHFLQAVANLLALMIERDRAHQAMEQQVKAQTHENERRLVATAQQQAILEERQRLARDLHDSVTQALYSVTLHAEVARRLLGSGDIANAAESLRALQATAQEALDEMRLLIFELRPPILAQAGLVAALQARLDAVEGRANLQTQLIVEGVRGLPTAIEQALYGIAREALNNALKHAYARHITVRLAQMHACVSLAVADDGVGFDPAAARAPGGLGLLGITERARQIGGQLTLQSARGAGTQLRVEVPL